MKRSIESGIVKPDDLGGNRPCDLVNCLLLSLVKTEGAYKGSPVRVR